FALIGVSSAISLGVVTGVLELVPGIGPLTAVLVASSQAQGKVLAIVLFLVALRLLQDYVVYPRLIQRGMHLSTLAVVLTIWCGAALARAPGVILAIPVAGFLSVSVRHFREYRDIERLVHPAKKRSGRFNRRVGGQEISTGE
ncbi:MAG TPA: AI-2E family transporter, partial [Vicinamibacterales bacterium]